MIHTLIPFQEIEEVLTKGVPTLSKLWTLDKSDTIVLIMYSTHILRTGYDVDNNNDWVLCITGKHTLSLLIPIYRLSDPFKLGILQRDPRV